MRYLLVALFVGVGLGALAVSCKNSEDVSNNSPTALGSREYPVDPVDLADAYEDEIRDEVFRAGYGEGYIEGLKEGERDGYDDGYTDGYDEGFFDGCVWLGNTLIANGADIWYQC